jgi:hypothetical protein
VPLVAHGVRRALALRRKYAADDVGGAERAIYASRVPIGLMPNVSAHESARVRMRYAARKSSTA